MTVPEHSAGPVWKDGEPYCPETGQALRLNLKAASKVYVPPAGKVLRQLTIPELRVLCSFPADFELTGTYVQRWERCGRAVPPLMMRAVAATIAREVFGCAG
jgi:site-specific DNA-cytosine methylase